ncbi:MAG: 16S rRNA processing protein RimM [Actinobacteria bacterium]|nr:16S rRNA processing protein RimM [Actinomycetota bacterium]
MTPRSDRTVAVGRITRAHGVGGEVAVLVLSEVEGRFADGAAVYLEDGRSLTVEESRPYRGRLLVRFREIPDRDRAERLLGMYLVVPESEVPELPEGAYWPHQLEGCEVVTEDGRSLGTLREVIANPANDIWVVVDGGSETLVPALRDVVVSVDVAAKRVVVREIPGLTTEG